MRLLFEIALINVYDYYVLIFIRKYFENWFSKCLLHIQNDPGKSKNKVKI